MTVLVLDIGSSSARAMLFDDRARAIADASVAQPYTMTTQPQGAGTFDVAVLRDAVETCIDRVLQHPRAGDIRAVGMDTFAHNILGLDSTGAALTPLYTYADSRSVPDIAQLREQIDAAAFHQRTGSVNHAAYLPGRLYWLRRTAPEIFTQVVRWVDIATYLYGLWLDHPVCSSSIASWSGMLDVAQRDWDQGWLDVLGLERTLLPDIADYHAVARGLAPDYAARWPQLRDVPFALGVGDGAAANVGSGSTDRNSIALSVGTTAALRVMLSGSAVLDVPSGLWRYVLDFEHYLVGGATTEGGNIYNWLRGVLQMPDSETIEDALITQMPGAHGLVVLPLLGGERSPGWRGYASGAIDGLRLSTTALDIVRAALEGVALRLALVSEQLADFVSAETPVYASGGALAASPGWSRLIANALNRPLHLLSEAEITARGTAILALRVLDPDFTPDPPERAAIYQPDPDHHAALRDALDRQHALYDHLSTDR